jgi:hypothetical protein
MSPRGARHGSPRELLPGLDLSMAARTVDKMRATLPGGNLGSYQITSLRPGSSRPTVGERYPRRLLGSIS